MNIYLRAIRTIANKYPAVIPHLNSNALKAMGYQGIRDDYWVVIYDAVEGYLTGDRPVTSFQNSFLEAMSMAFNDTVYLAWEEAGNDPPLDEDVQSWLGESIASERGNIVDLFSRLKTEWEGIDPAEEAIARADGYTSRLDALYNESKLRSVDNQMVTWELGQTERHCPTCSQLAGKRHRISYLLANDYIPRKPGAGMDCHGYNCDCRVLDKNGNEITIQ